MIRALSGLVVAVALMLGAPAMAQSTAPNGTYNVAGQDYTGSVTVTPNGQTYTVTWTIGGTTHSGVGIWTANGGVFSVGYSARGQGRDHVGVATYTRVQGGSGEEWAGPWAFVGENTAGEERWRR